MAGNNEDTSPLARLKRLFTKPEETGPKIDRLHLATCVILLDVARADNEFSPSEQHHIISVLGDRFALSREEAGELIQLAIEHRAQNADLWQYTHELNVSCTREEKLELLAEIWRIIYMDRTLNRHEDYLVHRLAKLLNLDHPEMIDVKMQVRREIFEED